MACGGRGVQNGVCRGNLKQRNKPLARTGRRCGDNIKIDLGGIELEHVVWLNVACNMGKLWAFVSEVI